MKLERTLIELEILVDYGCRYLLDINSAYEDGIEQGRDMVADLSIWEFCDLNGLSNDDILDSMDSDDIKEFCRNNYDAEDVYDDVLDELSEENIIEYAKMNLDMVTTEDATDFVKDNFDANEIYDTDEMLDAITPRDLFDYVTSNYALADWVSWRDDCLS